jgi:hypothetical protein
MALLTLSLLSLYRAIERSDRSSIQAISRLQDPRLQGAAFLAADEVSGIQRLYPGNRSEGDAMGTTPKIDIPFSTLTQVNLSPKPQELTIRSTNTKAPKY